MNLNYLEERIRSLECAVADLVKLDTDLQLLIRLSPDAIPHGIGAVLFNLGVHPYSPERKFRDASPIGEPQQPVSEEHGES